MGSRSRLAEFREPRPRLLHGLPKGIHAGSPIRVYVTEVSLVHYSDGRDTVHNGGYNYPNPPMQTNLQATALFVAELNQRAVEARSDTSFVAVDRPEDAQLFANLTILFGLEHGRSHRTYYANVDIGGMGLTGQKFGFGKDTPFQLGERARIWGYWMEAHQGDDYDFTTPGAAAQEAFRGTAKGIVNGWVCR